MNSLFGGGPLGANKQPSDSTSNASRPSSTPNSSAGGWGSMFKNAINQVESQLDKYLEIPPSEAGNSATSSSTMRGRGQQLRSGATRPRQRMEHRHAANGASPLDTPRSQSRAGSNAARSASVSRSSTPVPTAAKRNNAQESGAEASAGGSVVAGKDVVVANDDDSLDADLLDAFGVELENDAQANVTPGGAPAQEPSRNLDKPAASRAGQATDTSSVDAPAQPQQTDSSHETVGPRSPQDPATHAKTGAIQPPPLQSSSSTASPAPEPVVQTKTESPYIQAELKKLRAVPIPTNPEEIRAVIEEKNRKIEALLIEGQEWSTKELRLSNTIKKLRADSKGYEKTSQLVQKKLDAAVSKNDELNDKLKKASQADRTTAGNVKALNAKIHELEGQRKSVERELKASFDSRSSLRAVLTKVEDEAAELRRELAQARSAQDQEARKRGEEARAEADQQIAAVRADAEMAQQRLQAQVEELQQRLMVVEEESRDREVASLTQIRSLQSQLRSAEVQGSDMTAEIQEHTLPLLQQIEELQMRQTEQRHEWAAKEREWAAQARASARSVDKLEAELDARAAEVDEMKGKVDAESKWREATQAEVDRLNDQLRTEAKIRADIKQQLEESHETTRQLNSKLEGLASLRAAYIDTRARSESPANIGGSACEGLTAAPSSMPRDPALASPGSSERAGLGHGRTPSTSSVSSTNSRPRQGSGSEPPSGTSPSQQIQQQQQADMAAHASTKKLGAQITSLKAQLQTALKQKHEYSRSLVGMSVEVEKLRGANAHQQVLVSELDELKRRHATALEMLGEKTEEVMELQADINEMKEVYKQQLQEILLK